MEYILIKLDKLKKPAATAFLLFLGIAFLFKPPTDPDFGWHYKYGEHIVKTGRILRENTFSYTMPTYEWANSYWLSQIILYTLFETTGALGMTLILSILFTTALIILLKKRNLTQTSQLGSVALTGMFLGMYLITVRPMYFSSLFLLILIYTLLYERRYLKYIPLLFLIWANMHADFTLGLFVLGIFTLFQILEKFKQKTLSPNSFIKLMFIPTLSFLATFINPYGAHLWTTLFKEANPLQFAAIGEWRPPTTGTTVGANLSYGAIMFLISLFLSTSYLTRKKSGNWHFAVSIVFFALTCLSSYFFRVFLLINIFVVGRFWGDLGSRVFQKLSTDAQKGLRIFKVIVISGIFLLAIENLLTNVDTAATFEAWSQKGEYPYGAVRYIKSNKLSGNMLNTYEWGGYLIWQLPEHKTFIDGRMPSWRDEGSGLLLKEYLDTGKSIENLEAVVEKYDISWMVLKKNNALAKEAKKLSTWSTIYEDEFSVIYTTNSGN